MRDSDKVHERMEMFVIPVLFLYGGGYSDGDGEDFSGIIGQTDNGGCVMNGGNDIVNEYDIQGLSVG